LTAATLVDDFSTAAGSESRAVRHLKTAFAGARGAGISDVSWSCGGQTLRLSDTFKLENGPDSEPGWGEFCWRGPKLTLPQRLKRIFASANAEVQSLLYERARYYPEVVEVDGRKIERGWDRYFPSARSWYRRMSVPYYLMEGYYADPGLPRFLFPGLRMEQWQRRGSLYRWKGYRPQRKRGVNAVYSEHWNATAAPTLLREFGPDATVLDDSHVECGIAIALPLTLEGPTEIRFLIDGVTSLPKRMELGLPGLQCVVSGEGLNLDLSNFGIVEDEAYKRRLNIAGDRIRSFTSIVQRLQGNFLLLENRVTGAQHPSADTFEKELTRRLTGDF